MTEASHQMASNPLPPGERRAGTVGVGTGIQIGVMDDAGSLMPAHEQGEVVIQGPSVIDGYANNPEANAKSFTDGWFRTGDQGFLDADGYLSLVGRLKEMINRGGEKIAPREIDEVLLQHPAVAEAVAFGVAAPGLGRRGRRGRGAEGRRDREGADRVRAREARRLQGAEEALHRRADPADTAPARSSAGPSPPR